MSLLRLLAAGKSLVGLKHTNARYRVTGQGLLPQFCAKKNPFRAAASPVQEPGMASASQANSTELTANPPLTPDTVTAKTQPMVGGVGKENSAPRQRRHRLVDWASKCADRVTGMLHPRVAKPAKFTLPACAKPMMQGELSLERVKVVRNDLSDSDLDIVRRQPERAAPKLMLQVPKQQDPEPAQARWGRVSGSLSGVGKS